MAASACLPRIQQAYLGPCQIYVSEHHCDESCDLRLVVKYFRNIAPLYLFHGVLNTVDFEQVKVFWVVICQSVLWKMADYKIS